MLIRHVLQHLLRPPNVVFGDIFRFEMILAMSSDVPNRDATIFGKVPNEPNQFPAPFFGERGECEPNQVPVV